MATIGNSGVMTLTEWAKTLNPDGSPARIIGLLNQSNPILRDMPFMEGNSTFGHRITVDTALPAVYWRLINQGVVPSSGTTAQITEQIGQLVAWSNVDKTLAEANGNLAQFRMNKAKKHFEAMNQEMASTLFYGNQGTSPEEFTGLSLRYSSSTAGNGQNVLKAGGSGSDNASVWLVGWGEDRICGTFPKGSQVGLQHNDRGLQTIQTATGITGGQLLAYQDNFEWNMGIALSDWRYVVRICNIDVSNLVAESSNADLLKFMVRATHRLPTVEGVNPVFYCNKTVASWLDIQAMSKTNVYLTVGQEEGKPKTMVRGIPVRTCDALLDTEATVS